jgi:hypothetical protein
MDAPALPGVLEVCMERYRGGRWMV